jgi:hypothetical protein
LKLTHPDNLLGELPPPPPQPQPHPHPHPQPHRRPQQRQIIVITSILAILADDRRVSIAQFYFSKY